MLDDLISQLREGINDTQSRRSLYDAMANSSLGAAMAEEPARSGGRRRGGRNGGRKGGNVTLPGGKGGTRLEAFLDAISDQESGDNYKAVGVATKYGTALGKYQILDSNFVGPGGWDRETIGRDISKTAYMNNPRLQERIARGKLRNYFKKYGPVGAAKAWYAGEGNANTNSDSPQYGGPSINDYAAAVRRRMQQKLGRRR